VRFFISRRRRGERVKRGRGERRKREGKTRSEEVFFLSLSENLKEREGQMTEVLFTSKDQRERERDQGFFSFF